MAIQRLWLGVSGLVCAAAFSGCLTLYSKTEVVRGSEQRQPIRFENPQAAGQFYAELERKPRSLSSDGLSIPFVTFYQRERKLSDNAFFNEQVRACDLDQDGVITQQEAHIYARDYSTQPAPDTVTQASFQKPLAKGN